ncbi:MAG TPA: TIR domain-containing protein [Candidatus Angelobacter sp.]|nr:TIR domain-containing protein [Candidatus Angelobacter sp.]
MATVYFVDDDFASEMIVENLTLRGHTAARISTVDDALKRIGEICKADLVVLDLVMPHSASAASATDGERSTGMRVYRAVRDYRLDLPILVFTANQDPTILDIINVDPFARFVSRWSSPKSQEFLDMILEMLGIETTAELPRAFIVHGHDDATKLEVKNYLQNTLKLPEPIILHEQPNSGRTVIEKFEDYASSVELAFVILTPDDRAAASGDSDVEKRRARQNVILELGFFLGSFGRRSGRVFLLHKGPIEIPGDLAGVIYLDISHGISSVGDAIRRELEAIAQ